MTISPRFMDELRSRLSLSDIIGKRVKLQRAGRELKGCCPFHREKTPSFYVNDDKQFYHCFGCGAHGDAIGFVMQSGNLSFIEAIEILAAQAGLQVPQQTPQDVAKARREKSLYGLIEDTAKFFEEQLYQSAGAGALSYLRERGMTEDVCSAFRIGFAPSDGQALYQYLKRENYTDEQMVEAAVIRRSSRSGNPYSFFRERIMFPVADRRGRVVAFGGRILPDHLRLSSQGSGKPPKYINSSDFPLFNKGRMLYAESHARQAAADGQPIIVVEGYVDVIACAMAGYRGAVAPLGTALTEEQILALWKMIPDTGKTPILCFDGDEAGRRAASRACARILPLLQPDHSARFAFLPEGQDPDSILKSQGKKAFQAVLDAAIPLVDFVWNNHTSGRSFDTPEARAGLAQALEQEAARIGDRAVQHYYRQAFRERVQQAFSINKNRSYSGTSRGNVYGRYERNQKSFSRPPPLKVRRPAVADDSLRKQILLATLLNHPEIFDSVEEEVGAMNFGLERLDLLRQAAIHHLGSDPSLDREALHNHLKGQGLEDELGLILNERTYIHAGFARPEKETCLALAGWQDTWQFIHRKTVQKELHMAGRQLAKDINEESEQKWQALHDVHKASEGGNPL